MSDICYCSVGLHEECVGPIAHEGGLSCCCWADEEQVLSNLTYVAPEAKRGRPVKDNDEVGDILSTGRKRAAAAFPVEDGMPCEWSYLLYAGGGIEPIVGCKGTVLYAEKGKHALHHGPDKNTLNNEEGNVHRICTLCVSPDTRILTENLRWVRAAELKQGDRVIGFSEELGAAKTRFEPSVVVSTTRVQEPGYKIHMKNGDVLDASHNHMWVASRPGDKHVKWFRTEQFLKRNNTLANNHYTLRRLVKPWEEDRSWEAGWLAGFLDGEGSLSGYHLSVSQTDEGGNEVVTNLMYDALQARVAGRIHEIHRPQTGTHKEAWVLRITNLPDILSLLGRVRPARLLNKIPAFLAGKSPFAALKGITQEVSHLEYQGVKEYISVETTSKTFIAEGYLSHNCHNRWHTLNDQYYGKRPDDGTAFVPLGGVFHPHDPDTQATEAQLQKSETYWSTPIKQRGDLR